MFDLANLPQNTLMFIWLVLMCLEASMSILSLDSRGHYSDPGQRPWIYFPPRNLTLETQSAFLNALMLT